MKTTYIATALILSSVQAAEDCKALVLSGGGSKGAWEAGVYWGFTHYGNPEDFAYDVLSGVSAGSINTAGLCLWDKGSDLAASEWISDLWLNLKTSDVYKDWTTGWLAGLTVKSGIYNNAPLLEFMQTTFAEYTEWKRPAFFGSADVDTGNYLVWGQSNIERSEVEQAAVASASIPFIFPTAHFKDHTLMDGGTIYNVNIASAVEECRKKVSDDSQIIVDIMNCSSTNIEGEEDTGNTISNYMRSRAISSANKSLNDIYESQRAYPNVNFRYVVGMTYPVGSLAELSFDGEDTWPFQEAGRADAQTALAQGEGHGMKMIKKHVESKRDAEREAIKALKDQHNFMN